MAWISTVAVDAARGQLAAIYKAALARAGKVFAIVRLMSPQPKVLQASMALYMATTTDPDSPLPRWFRELIAVTVSRTNHCVY
jgi:alkylhydroperoxidase family enzyme